MINIAIALILFLKSSFLSSCFPSLLHGSCPVRQWSKSEESYSLALWFPKKDLEKQVSWIKLSESFNINPYFSRIKTWFFCPLWTLFSTDHWICPCSNTMLAVPPSSFSASFWFRYLSLRSEYCLISLSTERMGLISVFLFWFFYLQSKDIGNVVWSTGVCTAADPGSLFLCSLTGQCYTGENLFSSGLIPILKKIT